MEASVDDRKDHWETVYTTKSATAVSWYQADPGRSLELIRGASPDRRASVIDVGGGASTLVDRLLADGFQDLSVLDISGAALESARHRLGGDAARVSWIVADITQWTPTRTWNIWHDRAVFHFLTDPEQQKKYIAALEAAIPSGGTVIMATFALNGPEKCSGLPVQRYSPASLAQRLGPNFSLIDESSESHVTPWGSEQKFSYAVLSKVS